MLEQEEKASDDATYVLENLDEINLKALMRRAHSLRSRFKFAEACTDLEKLEILMNPRDNAIKDVQNMLDSCRKGKSERPFALTPVEERWERQTKHFIESYRACTSSVRKLEFLRQFDF